MKSNDETNNANEHNMVKNPNWREADQLAIYKHDRGVELGSTEKQLQLSGQSGTWTRDLRISSPVHVHEDPNHNSCRLVFCLIDCHFGFASCHLLHLIGLSDLGFCTQKWQGARLRLCSLAEVVYQLLFLLLPFLWLHWMTGYFLSWNNPF